jgi:indole-3-glycerol phosphate synthase
MVDYEIDDMNILEQIKAERLAAVKDAKRVVPVELLCEQAEDRVHHSFSAVIESAGFGIIAEMKKASPSAGLLRPEYYPAEIARSYVGNGAAGISVLTEPLHFMGDGAHLREVRAAVDIPLLRKDFMCDVYQVAEAAAWGADIVLLIAAMLSDDELQVLYEAAREYGLEVLAEVHSEDELERVLPLKDAMLGVNSRNLKTMKTDLNTLFMLADKIPSERLAVAESGIRSSADIAALRDVGYRAFLIGEALMVKGDPGGMLRELLNC